MLLLREADVRAVLTMPNAVRCVEEAFRRQGMGEEMRGQPRTRVRFPDQDAQRFNAAGSDSLLHRGIDDGLVRRAGTIVDSHVQARAEAGDLLAAHQQGWLDVDLHSELGDVASLGDEISFIGIAE